jgi:hypothetical protein
MKRLLPLVLVCATMLMPDPSQAQNGGTGTLRINLGTYGRIRLATPGTGAVRQLSRMSGIFALDSSAVFDYYEDAEAVEAPATTTGGLADTILSVTVNGTYALRPPHVTLRNLVYMWSGDDYVISRYVYRNDSSAAVTATIGVAVVPQPSAEFGFESVEYDPATEIAYYYRTGQDAYIGVKVLSGPAYSFHSMDWEVYSPDPDNDYSNDSIRSFLTIPPGFDARYDAGPVGSVMHLNAGAYTVQPGDSVTVDYALMYATSPQALLALGAVAQQRHDGTFTSVEPVASGIPEAYALRQNYPNPFNPSTRIRFDVAERGFVTLKVYDLLGREVATLLDQDLSPGTYDVPFSGENLPSGAYVISMQAGAFRSTGKMLLMK